MQLGFCAKATFECGAASAGVHDFDPDETARLGLSDQPPDLPAGQTQLEPDLVLSLILLVVQFGGTDREEFIGVGVGV